MEEIKFWNVENNYWVFWRAEEASDQFSIQDRIKTALSALNPTNSRSSRHLLIQFWAATTTMTEDGRRLLTTSGQPFAINCRTDEKLIQYKRDSSIYKYVAQGEEDRNLTDGPISRVFRSQLPEMSPDLSYYSVKEYPERDLALRCGIKQTLVLPVFEPSRQCCVGVLELLFTKYIVSTFSRYILSVGRTFQELGLGLETPNPVHLDRQIPKVQLVVREELKEAMAQVRETHDLPLARLWARCEHISSVDPGGSLNRSYNDSGVNCWRELLVSIPGMWVSDSDASSYIEYNDASSYLPLTVGQGPVGKVFHSDKPCFCTDVAQLSIIDYPMAHFAHMLRFTGCFSVCLQSIGTGNRVFVIEFFLPQDKRPSGDLHNLISSILTILKQHLKSFEVVTRDIGKVDNLTEFNMEASLVKGKNVISAEEGNTYFTYNPLSTSSGHETTSTSWEFTSFHTISSLYIYSGYETISSSDTYSGDETISSSNTYSGYESMSISAEGES